MTPPHPAPPIPSLEELAISARVVSIPMRVKFRGVLERESLLVRGPAGWGEFCPFLEYDDAESAPWLASAIEAAWFGFPSAVRTRVPVNATVPAVGPDAVEGVLSRFGAVGAVKVKVAEKGQSLADDVARIGEVRRLLPDADIKVDANGGWEVGEALVALDALSRFDLQYVEQPVADIPGLRAVRLELRRRGESVLVAADESVRRQEDPLLVAREDAADLLVIKAPPLGGVRRALDIIDRAGLPAVVSSALDTSVGIRAGVALAAALPDLPYACGLATVSLMAGDVADAPLVAQDGHLPVRDVAVSEEKLQRFAAAPARRQWWLDRLGRAHAVLAGVERDSFGRENDTGKSHSGNTGSTGER
ncbi:O-succinylbenzoate synthase [Arthrobacter cheniae]|uniref:o-succinylbenzoate synthase n=1 Tax=Arthrobacter cheniae TaxID=1258888 RepID=A0A3A5MFK0_9MICC|nr:o-succinylbenzoate synthase [Arthrobacter cheniae]RJT83113.1 O-succinylbenzoate synthase [Arthrobacter cheniae]